MGSAVLPLRSKANTHLAGSFHPGIFRPEMLLPMGLPPGVRVIAWGISLERPTMIKYNIKNIRTLFGHRVKVTKTRASPMCRFDKSTAGVSPITGPTRADGSGRPADLSGAVGQ